MVQTVVRPVEPASLVSGDDAQLAIDALHDVSERRLCYTQIYLIHAAIVFVATVVYAHSSSQSIR